jgi:hypothetical protein
MHHDEILLMPKKAKELSALAVSKLKADAEYYVGGADGLYLRIIGRSRVWGLRIVMGARINKAGKTVPRRLNMGLGPIPKFRCQKRAIRRVNSVSRSVMALIPLQKNTLEKRLKKLWHVSKRHFVNALKP